MRVDNQREDGRLGLTADCATRASTEPASGLGPDGRVSTDAGHTPAPWFVVPWKYSVGICTKAGGRYGDRIAETVQWTGFKGKPDRAASLANARLIAAAPELLEALKEYMACVALTTQPAMRNADIITLHEVAKRLDAARVGAEAAIAKATGAA